MNETMMNLTNATATVLPPLTQNEVLVFSLELVAASLVIGFLLLWWMGEL